MIYSLDGSLTFNGTFEVTCSLVLYAFGGLSDLLGVGGFAFNLFLFALSSDVSRPRLKASKLVYLDAVSPAREVYQINYLVTYIELFDVVG